ncbi:MAG: winged helix-turn-helix transcriptional regulator [Lachnospirales bacterium]
MTKKDSFFSDNEYTIMTEISGNEHVTQRELSKKLGVSVSTINLLINKMIKEGLVKMTQVSQKQVLYMLTPVGIIEKTKKTERYIKYHYRVIYETKKKINDILIQLSKSFDNIYVLKNDEVFSEIIDVVIDELKSNKLDSNFILLNSLENLNLVNNSKEVIVYMTQNENLFLDLEKINNATTSLETINLSELL